MSEHDRIETPDDGGQTAPCRSDRDTLRVPPSPVVLRGDEVAASKAARAHAIRFPPWRMGSSATAVARPVNGVSPRRPRSR
jgi:hypothetical protein